MNFETIEAEREFHRSRDRETFNVYCRYSNRIETRKLLLENGYEIVDERDLTGTSQLSRFTLKV